ncbi:type II secretion system F family protein [Paraburkholderia tagetis]|uniref:Type II secretion system F family protein n=1 Tax=Paraburkholderia tagetis TaxID=2913261 RepID=A0A9X1RQC2_9BURK|nr:type II secretion system F family protein [Paraburkholderia tagetis]MCG5073932.1 type II secretion system F family protein [Paraburkholderia tagetis]
MSSAIALIAALALLFAAAGLMLWQQAQQRASREHVTRFVDSRVNAATQATGASGMRVAAGSGASRSGAARPAGASRPDEVRAAYVGGNTATRGGALPLAATQPQGWRARATFALQGMLSRAGIVDVRKPFVFVGFIAIALTLWAFVLGGGPAALAVLVLMVALVAFVLSVRMQRRRTRLVAQLPSFLDGIVRLIVLGNSVPAAFQAALPTTEAPLRECLDHVSRMLRAGVEIDRALGHVARVYRARELEFVGAVLRLSVRYGGRADVMLERMATFMRDLEQAQRELVAMSAETRLSAWVLALLPLGIAGFLIVTNPQYFASMWNDHSGRLLVYGAIGLQMTGAYLLYRLTRFKGAL